MENKNDRESWHRFINKIHRLLSYNLKVRVILTRHGTKDYLYIDDKDNIWADNYQVNIFCPEQQSWHFIHNPEECCEIQYEGWVTLTEEEVDDDR